MTIVGRARPRMRDALTTRHDRSLADALCAEHRLLATQLDVLDRVADEIGAARLEVIRRDVDRAFDLLARKVLPHEEAELALRSRLAERDAVPLAADHDHDETRRLVAHVGALKARLARGGDTADALSDIRQALYELHALTRLHFADQVCDPEKDDGAAPA